MASPTYVVWVSYPFEVPRHQKVTHHTFILRTRIVEKTKDVVSMEKEAVVSSQKIEVEDAPYLRLIIESIRRTAEYASDIAEVVLNLTVESILL